MSNSRGYSVPTPDWFQEMADSVLRAVFFIVQTKPQLSFEFINSGTTTELVGHSPDTSPEQAAVLLSHIHPDSERSLARLLALEPGSSMTVELKWRHVSGQITHSRGFARARQRPDNSVVIEGVVQDISELHAAQQAVARSEERHRLLAEHAAAIVWSMNPDGAVTYLSAAVEPLRGFSVAEALRHRTDDVFLPDSAADIRAFIAEMNAALARGERPEARDLEVRCYRRDGSVMISAMSVIPHLDPAGKLVEVVGIIQDVGDRRTMEAELLRMATTDPLTGVANRRSGEDALSAAVGGPGGSRHALLMIDLDNFKNINDTRGHPAGDRTLTEVARCISRAVRSGDVVTRWGGDEFLVLLNNCALDDAVAIAATIQSRLDGTGISVSAGAAELDPTTGWAASVRRADDALFRAKRSARGGVAI